MKIDRFRDRLAARAFLPMLMIILPVLVQAQTLRGDGVSVYTQRSLGLVTVGGGCSGTLLNQYWVLSVRHCYTVDGLVHTALRPASEFKVTAAWTSTVGTVERIYDFRVNSPASEPGRDIALLYLGSKNLGPVDAQKIFTVYRNGKISGRLSTSDTATQYGRGYSTFATDLKTPSAGDGPYRSAIFTPSNITDSHYDFLINADNQVGHSGDSGGPSFVNVRGQSTAGIAGVQSSCRATGYVDGAPAKSYKWATGISFCRYVSTEPFLSEIAATIKEEPLKTPFINSRVVPVLRQYQPFASVILTWDGGPAYPNIQVYVSVNKGPEIPAYSVEFPQVSPLWKAPRSGGEHKLPWSSGHYRYLLKSGGITLAITEFYVP